MTDEERIRQRLSQEELYRRHRDKVHKLRRLVAGDVGALDDSGNASETELSQVYKPDSDNWYDILNVDVEDGRSNELFQAYRTLLFQVAYASPDYEFEGLEPELAAVNSLYLKDRMARCNASAQARRALGDFLIGGMGCVWVCVKNGLPHVQWLDSMDYIFDTTGQTFMDAKWGAATVRMPLYRWVEMFGSKVKRIVQEENDEIVIPLKFYYDVDGEKGRFAVFSNGSDADPIELTVNPYTIPMGSDEAPMLPFQVMHYLEMPSMKLPLSAMEMMLPHQIAIWRVQRVIRDTADAGQPAWLVPEGSVDPKAFNDWLDGETGSVLMVKQGQPMPSRLPGDEVPQTLIADLRRNEQGIMAQSGANPYSSGDRVEGIDFAAEVNAIQANSSLVAATLAREFAKFYSETARKVLAVGKAYDQRPITIRYDGLNLTFDESDPIGDYLSPEADLVVSESSIQFSPQQQKIALASAKLDAALKVAQLFPQGVAKAYEALLSAMGEKDVAAWLEQPQQQAAMPDPAAMAAANAQF